MPPILSKLNGKVVHSQTREVVYNVLNFMDSEAKNGEVLIPLRKVQERTASATGVGLRTIRKIKNEGEKLTSAATSPSTFSTPNKKRNCKKPVTGLDNFDECAVRRIVHNFYKTEKCVPTVETLREKLKEDLNYEGGKTSLRKILRNLGFRWRKTKTNRKILIEKHDIRETRISFLRNIAKYRKEGRPIVYMDETYILSSHVTGNSWNDDTNEGLHQPISKGERLIIVHAGGENGFIPNALLIWKSTQASGDYHHQMNATNFEKWLLEKLIPNLRPNSVLIVDNAPYHNVQVDKAPNSNSKKCDMIAWLHEHNIDFDESMLKPQLYKLILLHKPAQKKFSMDRICAAYGHSVLRLPPYHPDLNPIERIWAEMKQYVGVRNTTFKTQHVRQLCEEKFSTMDDAWKRLCESVKRLENIYMENEGIIDSVVDQLIVTLGEVNSDESSSDNNASSSDDIDSD